MERRGEASREARVRGEGGGRSAVEERRCGAAAGSECDGTLLVFVIILEKFAWPSSSAGPRTME